MKSSSSLVLGAFTSQFKQLCADLVRVFPKDVDIRAATNMLTQLCATNPRLLLIVFRDAIAIPYGPTLEKGDLLFFLKKDYTNDLKGIRFANADYVLAKIDTLRHPIEGLDAVSKELVLRYFQNLTKLSMAFA